MSTRRWKECRRRRTFLVTRRLSTSRILRGFFGKFDPLMETFLECETTCHEPPPGHVFVGSLAESGRSGAWFMSQKNCLCNPFLSLLRPQPHLPSSFQIHPSFRDLLGKTTFQIVTTIGDPIGIGDNEWVNGSLVSCKQSFVSVLPCFKACYPVKV